MATQQRSREQELRQQAAEAMAELDRITRRMGTIDEEIEGERAAISRQRIQAAKAGESPAFAVDRVGLEGLLAEREELPEVHFASRLRAAGSQIALEEARVAELTPQIEEAEENPRPLVEAARAAQTKADQAAAHLSELENAQGAARDRSKRHEELLQRIEQEGPRPLY